MLSAVWVSSTINILIFDGACIVVQKESMESSLITITVNLVILAAIIFNVLIKTVGKMCLMDF